MQELMRLIGQKYVTEEGLLHLGTKVIKDKFIPLERVPFLKKF